MLPRNTISPQDLDLLSVSDDPEEICELVCKAYHASFNVSDPHQEQSIR